MNSDLSSRTGNTLSDLADSAGGLRDSASQALSRTTAQAEDLARRGIDKARSAAYDMRDRAMRAGDATVSRIQEEPVKAMLVAAAAGALAAMLVRWMTERSSRL